MEGLLRVHKPIGWTSFDVVNYVRKMVAQAEGRKPKQVKVGHIGTLDPLADGLLVLLIGKSYTRLAETLSKRDKTYDVSMRLGVTSSTGDEEGEKRLESNVVPSQSLLLDACMSFVGDSLQTPPAFSAIKVNGVRAYKLAREGATLELRQRPVHIAALTLESYTYPEVHFRVHVSSGTYIRSLVRDIGERLGTGAYMSGLTRESIGEWQLVGAVMLENIDPAIIAAHLETVVPVA